MRSLYRRAVLALMIGVALTLGTTGSRAQENPQVDIVTSLGTMVVELYADKAPATVANFLAYVDDGFYDGLIFHRVIPGFVIQGGGFTPDFRRRPTNPPIALESNTGLRNQIGTIAMARTRDPDSATAQFFFNLAANAPLDYRGPSSPGYAVFGRIVTGLSVMRAISQRPTGAGGPFPGDVPRETVLIESIKRR